MHKKFIIITFINFFNLSHNMSLILPGYSAVQENHVYVKENLATKLSTSEQISIQRVIILNRFTEPTPQEIAEYIQKKAATALITTREKVQDDSVLELLLQDKVRPQELTKALAAGNKEISTSLNLNIPLLVNPHHRASYLILLYGLVPSDTITPKVLSEPFGYSNLLSSSSLIEEGFGRRMQLKILCQSQLPTQEALTKSLTKSKPYSDKIDGFMVEVFSSNAHELINYECSNEEISSVLTTIYQSALNRDFSLAYPQVYNASSLVLEEISAYMVKNIIHAHQLGLLRLNQDNSLDETSFFKLLGKQNIGEC